MSFEVEPQALRRSAGAAREVAAVARRLRFDAVGDMAAGLPGSMSSEAAPRAEEQLRADADSSAANMTGYAENLDTSAEEYEALERDVAAGLS